MRFRIEQVAESLGTSVSTLRRWEKEMRLSFVVERAPSGVRVYSKKQIVELKRLARRLHREQLKRLTAGIRRGATQ